MVSESREQDLHRGQRSARPQSRVTTVAARAHGASGGRYIQPRARLEQPPRRIRPQLGRHERAQQRAIRALRVAQRVARSQVIAVQAARASSTDSAGPRRLLAVRQELLGEHPEHERDDHDQIHHAGREQEQHQRPAAAETIDAVTGAPPQRAERSGAPVLEQIRKRRSSSPSTSPTAATGARDPSRRSSSTPTHRASCRTCRERAERSRSGS